MIAELMKKPVVDIGTIECPKGEKNSRAYWRDAEADKPQKDGEYIVCTVGVMDCEFQKRVYLTEFKTASGWEYIEGEVITHWLDNAPSLPEVVVR